MENRLALMNRLIPFAAIYLVLLGSCQPHRQKKESESEVAFQTLFLNTVLDSTVTLAQINEAAKVFVDSLAVIAADESNQNNRLAAQQWGYLTIDCLLEKYNETISAGKDANYDGIPPLLEKINDALNLWFYTEDGQSPRIWRDHFYVCHQRTGNPVDGSFHITVSIPTKDCPNPTLEIFYPDDAVDMPVLIFGRYLKDGCTEEDYEHQEIIPLSDWSGKDEIRDGVPMHAKGGVDVVNKMLDYDVLYLMFRSRSSSDGSPTETELARLSLEPFQRQWWEAVER